MTYDLNKPTVVVYFPLSTNQFKHIPLEATLLWTLADTMNIFYVSRHWTEASIKDYIKAGIPTPENIIYQGPERVQIQTRHGTEDEVTSEEHFDNQNHVLDFVQSLGLTISRIINFGQIQSGFGSKPRTYESFIELFKTSNTQPRDSIYRDYLMMFSIHDIIRRDHNVHYMEISGDPVFFSYRPDFDISAVYYNDSSSSDYTLFPGLQIWYDRVKPLVVPHDMKTTNFVFGMSANSPSRYVMLDKLKVLLKDEEFYYKTNRTIKDPNYNQGTFLGYDKYQDLIAKARFTLIIPPYHEDHFSTLRLVQAVYNNTCPLFMDCNMEVLKRDYDIDVACIEDLIIQDELTFVSEQRRVEALVYLKDKLSTYDYPRFT